MHRFRIMEWVLGFRFPTSEVVVESELGRCPESGTGSRLHCHFGERRVPTEIYIRVSHRVPETRCTKEKEISTKGVVNKPVFASTWMAMTMLRQRAGAGAVLVGSRRHLFGGKMTGCRDISSKHMLSGYLIATFWPARLHANSRCNKEL